MNQSTEAHTAYMRLWRTPEHRKRYKWTENLRTNDDEQVFQALATFSRQMWDYTAPPLVHASLEM